ncbi:MAG: polyprenyl diphosphate synthase [Candidatus Puniceispirillum sp.]
MSSAPHHLAIIMDGNRRWAKKRGLNALRGHRQGADVLRTICDHSYKSGVRWLTVFAFSAQNWTRPKTEVDGLMALMHRFLVNDAKEFMQENVKFRVIGRRDRLSPELVELITETESQTKGNSGLNLTIAIDYGGQQEVTSAAKLLAEEAAKGIISADDITEDLVKSRMMSSMLPQVDLLIRTGGEYRVSNFLLWDISYAELHFTPVFWPDFSERDLDKALRDFSQRERRFGGDGETQTPFSATVTKL